MNKDESQSSTTGPNASKKILPANEGGPAETPPPKTKHFYSRISPIARLAIVFGIAIIGVTIWLLVADKPSTGNSDTGTTATPTSTDNEPHTTRAIEDQQGTASLPAYAQEAWSLNKNGSVATLMDGQEKILERTLNDWEHTTAYSAGMLYFVSIDPENTPDQSVTSYRFYGFDLTSKNYIELDSIRDANPNIYLSDISVEGDRLLARFDSYMQDGLTYSCRIQVDRSCSKFTVFSNHDGAFYYRSNNWLNIDGFGDAGFITYTISRYDDSNNILSKITSTSSEFANGTEFVALDDSGRIWITETTSDQQAIDSDVQFIRLYALDISGKTVTEYTADTIPLTSIQRTCQSALYKICFDNDTEQIVFNTNTEVFSDPSPTSEPASMPYDDMAIERTLDRLRLQSEYTLEINL